MDFYNNMVLDMNNNQEYLKQGIFNYLKNPNVGCLSSGTSMGIDMTVIIMDGR